MIYCAGLELHALSSPTGTRYTLGPVQVLQLPQSGTYTSLISEYSRDTFSIHVDQITP